MKLFQKSVKLARGAVMKLLLQTVGQSRLKEQRIFGLITPSLSALNMKFDIWIAEATFIGLLMCLALRHEFTFFPAPMFRLLRATVLMSEFYPTLISK
jgi:hypothetical protein